MKKFTIAQAALILMIAVGRLREWISRGYIAPFEKSSGRGSSHKLDVQNLYEIKLFDHLLSKRGLSRAKAVNVIRELKKIALPMIMLLFVRLRKEWASSIIELRTARQ